VSAEPIAIDGSGNMDRAISFNQGAVKNLAKSVRDFLTGEIAK
jgi:hypothetical protein